VKTIIDHLETYDRRRVARERLAYWRGLCNGFLIGVLGSVVIGIVGYVIWGM